MKEVAGHSAVGSRLRGNDVMVAGMTGVRAGMTWVGARLTEVGAGMTRWLRE